MKVDIPVYIIEDKFIEALNNRLIPLKRMLYIKKLIDEQLEIRKNECPKDTCSHSIDKHELIDKDTYWECTECFKGGNTICLGVGDWELWKDTEDKLKEYIKK